MFSRIIQRASITCKNSLVSSRVPSFNKIYLTERRCFSILTFKDESAGTIQELKERLEKKMGVEVGYNPLLQVEKSQSFQYPLTNQEELPHRTMKDSFTSAIIPLSKDAGLQDKYITFLGRVRVGRLLEDMDIFAVYVAHKHILNPKVPEDKITPYTLVTVLVDKMTFSDFTPKSNADIRLSGHVTWVGKSSIEVVVWLEQKSQGDWVMLTKAFFLMAARNAAADAAAHVNVLTATNEEEKRILEKGHTRKKERSIVQDLTQVIPNMEEQKIIHALFTKTAFVDEFDLKKRGLPTRFVWMESAKLANLIFSHPENRNLHNKVFGGFLMRQANELSWALGFIYSKFRPSLKSISNVSFKKPISVSSLIKMKAHVVYTHLQYFQITVFAEALDSATGESTSTNVFNFTYYIPELAPEVIPRTYKETLMYIDGRRHFHNVMSSECKN